MAEARNNESRFGGEFMIQDRDHMSDTAPANETANRGGARQIEQSQDGGRQQGGDHNADRQQGDRRSQFH
jgi:hypothetical protein